MNYTFFKRGPRQKRITGCPGWFCTDWRTHMNIETGSGHRPEHLHIRKSNIFKDDWSFRGLTNGLLFRLKGMGLCKLFTVDLIFDCLWSRLFTITDYFIVNRKLEQLPQGTGWHSHSFCPIVVNRNSYNNFVVLRGKAFNIKRTPHTSARQDVCRRACKSVIIKTY